MGQIAVHPRIGYDYDYYKHKQNLPSNPGVKHAEIIRKLGRPAKPNGLFLVPLFLGGPRLRRKIRRVCMFHKEHFHGQGFS